MAGKGVFRGSLIGIAGRRLSWMPNLKKSQAVGKGDKETMGNQLMTILTTKLMKKTMMTRSIIFVPAKRATCWLRNARDRATGHRHYTMCCHIVLAVVLIFH